MSLELVERFDPAIIERIVSEPDIWERCNQGVEDFKPVELPTERWLLCYAKEGVIGAWWLKSRSFQMAEVHPMILPEYRQQYSRRSEELMCQWLRDHTKAQKAVAEIPVIYKDVLAFATRQGWQREGMFKQAASIGGKLIDVQIMGKNLWAA